VGICILSTEVDKGGKDAMEFLLHAGWCSHIQIPGKHNAESPNQSLLKKDRSFYEIESGWFLFGFCCLSHFGGHIFIFSSLFLLTTGAKNYQVDKDFHITSCSQEVELSDKCQISSIINL